MEYRTIILKLDETDRPPLPEGKISKHARGRYVRGQQEWFERTTEPVREHAREIGCVALSQLWHTGELMVAVPHEDFDKKVESLRGAAGVIDYAPYEPRTIAGDDAAGISIDN